MRKGLLIIITSTLIVAFVAFYNREIVNFGATVLLTNSTDTIGLFRTNVNTSLTNLNNAIGGSSTIDNATGTIVNFNFTNATGTGNLQVATLKTTGNANVSGTLNVTGQTGLGLFNFINATGTGNLNAGTIRSEGDASVSGTLRVQAATTLNFSLGVAGVSSLAGLSFTNATGTGNLQVATAQFTGAVGASSTLNVQGVLDSRGGLTFVNATGTGNLTVNTLNITNGDEYRVRIGTFSFNNPSSSVHRSGVNRFSVPVDSTLIGFECFSTGATSTAVHGTSTIYAERRVSSTPNTLGTALLTALTWTCGVSTSTTAFATTTILAGNTILASVESALGQPSSTTVIFRLRTND